MTYWIALCGFLCGCFFTMGMVDVAQRAWTSALGNLAVALGSGIAVLVLGW